MIQSVFALPASIDLCYVRFVSSFCKICNQNSHSFFHNRQHNQIPQRFKNSRKPEEEQQLENVLTLNSNLELLILSKEGSIQMYRQNYIQKNLLIELRKLIFQHRLMLFQIDLQRRCIFQQKLVQMQLPKSQKGR